MYGRKQAPRAWNLRIDNFLVQQKYTKCTIEHGIYIRNRRNDVLIICLYVDDLLITGSNIEDMVEFKKRIMQEFDMTNLGELSYFLDIEYPKRSEGIFLHQKKYVKTFWGGST